MYTAAHGEKMLAERSLIGMMKRVYSRGKYDNVSEKQQSASLSLSNNNSS
jgi:hypothetical protein